MAVRRSPNGRWNVFKAWTSYTTVAGRNVDWQEHARRFPQPWTIDERPESFIVRDANVEALGYCARRRGGSGLPLHQEKAGC
jgi:hypothetical protein